MRIPGNLTAGSICNWADCWYRAALEHLYPCHDEKPDEIKDDRYQKSTQAHPYVRTVKIVEQVYSKHQDIGQWANEGVFDKHEDQLEEKGQQ